LAFFGAIGPYNLPPFFMDRYEVTNREYQVFVDKGGYQNRAYWKQPFIKDGKTLSWDDAMSAFRDTTGRPGPSSREAGHFPSGKDDYPVTGVSWFEAAAYAEFAQKSLPVIAEGLMAQPPDFDQFVMPLSNLAETAAPVGQSKAIGTFGTFDLIGNVREWYWNASSDDRRFALGRNPSSYGPEALPPWDRSALDGFRCVRNDGAIPDDAAAPRPMLVRDFTKATPATTEVFNVYRKMFAYDKRPLHETVEPSPDGAQDWTREKITFDAAYHGDRMSAFLFLPKQATPPYQTVVFFPSARVNFARSSATLGDLRYVDYVIKSGRAVIYPIYAGLYERSTTTPIVPGATDRRETLIEWSKDLGRSVDYLETRRDIDAKRIGYLGVSQGAAEGLFAVALEDRLRAVVFLDGGFFQNPKPIAGTDQADFAPRITKPVLMINGRYDSTFPLETAQLPMMRMLGTPAADKRHVIFETPHDVNLRRDDLVREVLAWFDKYLGRVN
jgi:dienelactone hydrolase